MAYVDGFVLPVPKKKLPAYLKLAKLASKVFREHGALEYREAVADDMDPKGMLPFPKTVKAKPDETIVFAWVVYKSRAHRDRVNAKIMKDERLACIGTEMPFDCKRMAYGGFKIVISR